MAADDKGEENEKSNSGGWKVLQDGCVLPTYDVSRGLSMINIALSLYHKARLFFEGYLYCPSFFVVVYGSKLQ